MDWHLGAVAQAHRFDVSHLLPGPSAHGPSVGMLHKNWIGFDDPSSWWPGASTATSLRSQMRVIGWWICALMAPDRRMPLKWLSWWVSMPMTDVIDYVGRMTDRMGLLEEKMDVLKTQLTRVRAQLGNVMEFVASKHPDAVDEFRLHLQQWSSLWTSTFGFCQPLQAFDTFCRSMLLATELHRYIADPARSHLSESKVAWPFDM